MKGSGMDPWAELEDLRQSKAMLEVRVQELGTDLEDLKEICAAKGVQYQDALAARRHRRSFARTCSEHGISATATVCDTLSVLPIGHLAAEMSGNFSKLAQASRCDLDHLMHFIESSREFRLAYLVWGQGASP